VRLLITVSTLLVLSSCGSGPEKQGQSAAAPAASAPKPKPKPSAEPMLFPKKDRVSTDVQEAPLFGNAVLPAGNVAHYKAGKQEFDLFHIKTKSGLDAAILLSDYKSKLADSKVVPGFGGFFGQDGGVPVFVFVKNEYLLGVRGLAEKDADRISREFASLVR
jgi:hypothetical protein